MDSAHQRADRHVGGCPETAGMVRKPLDHRRISQGTENRLRHRANAVSSRRAPGTDDRPPVCRRCHVGESADCSTPRGRCPNLRHTIRAATVRPRVERLALSGTPPELDDPGSHSGTGSAWRTPKPQRRRTAGMANSVAWLERTSIDGRVCPQCRHRKKRLKLRRKPPGQARLQLCRDRFAKSAACVSVGAMLFQRQLHPTSRLTLRLRRTRQVSTDDARSASRRRSFLARQLTTRRTICNLKVTYYG